MAGFTERLQILIAERELDRADIASRNTARNLQAIGTAGIAGSSALLVGLGALAKVSDEADIQTKLKGVVSDKTRLALASFIDDPEQELEDLNNDKESMMIPPLERDDNSDDTSNSKEAPPVSE